MRYIVGRGNYPLLAQALRLLPPVGLVPSSHEGTQLRLIEADSYFLIGYSAPFKEEGTHAS
eukprot:1159804-Pelagomonas_calceolata.AAC.5